MQIKGKHEKKICPIEKTSSCWVIITDYSKHCALSCRFEFEKNQEQQGKDKSQDRQKELWYKEKSCLFLLAKHIQEPQGERFLHEQIQNVVLLLHLLLEQSKSPSARPIAAMGTVQGLSYYTLTEQGLLFQALGCTAVTVCLAEKS